ncbi:MAG: DUF86 domain-containing protein [Salinibacter sp.]
MSRSQKQYLLDILDAMDKARCFVEDVTFEDLESDHRTQFALQRAFEIIGEATKHLDDDLREEYDEVPWNDMAGMRDMLIHEYFAVDLTVVWDTVHNRFTEVQPRLRQILDEISDDESTP